VVASILVVDDDAAVREALTQLLELEGYRVTPAANGLEALNLLRNKQAASLVLLDLMMPVMDGWAFLAERARDPTLAAIPVIVISAATQRGDRLDTVACLRKPIDPEALLELIEHLC
jgi:CheY-like chemotaxis protein